MKIKFKNYKFFKFCQIWFIYFRRILQIEDNIIRYSINLIIILYNVIFAQSKKKQNHDD